MEPNKHSSADITWLCLWAHVETGVGTSYKSLLILSPFVSPSPIPRPLTNHYLHTFSRHRFVFCFLPPTLCEFRAVLRPQAKLQRQILLAQVFVLELVFVPNQEPVFTSDKQPAFLPIHQWIVWRREPPSQFSSSSPDSGIATFTSFRRM